MEPTLLSMALILPLYMLLTGPGGTNGPSKSKAGAEAESQASVAPANTKKAGAKPAQTKPAETKLAETKPAKAKRIDHSGKTRKGKASYYGSRFYDRKMANGKPMDPRSNVAASKTLPLGTKAKVTNLENGKSEVVVIEDRGPYVR